MKGIIALRMCDMSKYGGLPLEYGTVPAPVWRNLHPRLRMGTAARARAGVGELIRTSLQRQGGDPAFSAACGDYTSGGLQGLEHLLRIVLSCLATR